MCLFLKDLCGSGSETDLRVSTWLLLGSRVCNVVFVWTAMIRLINYFINALPVPLTLLTGATTVTCAPEPITAELQPTTASRFIHAAAQAGPGFCQWFSPALLCASKLTAVDHMRLNESEEIRRRADNKVESESVDVRV